MLNVHYIHCKESIHFINIILCIIIIILLFTNNHHKEQFITWFDYKHRAPKTSPKTYTCRRHVIKQDIVIGSYNYPNKDVASYKITSKIINLLLYNSNITNIKTRKFNTDDIIYSNLLTGNADIALVSTPIIYNRMRDAKKTKIERHDLNIKPVNFIASMNTLFLYVIVSQLGPIRSIHDIKNQKKVGVDVSKHGKTLGWICAKHIFDYLELTEGRDYVFVYDNYKKNTAKVNSGEIDCMILPDVYPSKIISRLFTNNLDNTLRILPLDEISEDKFTSKYPFYKRGYVNLRKIADNYIPAIIGDFKYTTFKPILTTYIFHNYLLGSHKVDNDIGKSVLKTMFDNIDNINKLPSMVSTPIDKYNLVHDFLYIPLNKGVREYYYNKGYITYYNNPDCKYLVGHKKCSKENIDNVTSMSSI